MPKIREVDFVAPGSPEQVAERLREDLRPTVFPHNASIFGRGGLQGSVNAQSIYVSDDTRVWFRQIRPVARCKLTETANGTRVHGSIGIPTWVVWGLRLAVLMMPVVLASTFGQALSTGELAWGAVGLITAAFLGLMVASVGRQVFNADESVQALADRLEDTLEASPQAAILQGAKVAEGS